jgi:release factor glutamine methyltransferase
MLSIRNVLATAERTLSATSRTPRLDAEILLAHTLGCTRAHLLASFHEQLDQEQVLAFQRLITRRAHSEPVAYLTRQREFYGLDLFIDQRVLVPRPETELLVDLALIAARRMQATTSADLKIADIGTGSGAVALALAANLPPQTRIYATDISADALHVAAANATHHGLTSQVRLLQGDLLASLPEPVHLIVSNPPYTVIDEIDAGVRDHEPRLALDGGSNGLEVYRRLIPQAAEWLHTDVDSCVLLEIGATQAAAVLDIARQAFPRAALEVRKDLAGHDRVAMIEVPRHA